MNYSWQGSNNKKLSKLQDLYNKEADSNKDFISFSNEEMPLIHICNTDAPKNTTFWYIQNISSASTRELIEHYLKYKQINNIKNILIKDASYSPIYGYAHILLNQNNNVIYLRNEHEIDDYMIYLLVEDRIDASS
jgi:hypothetical protein